MAAGRVSGTTKSVAFRKSADADKSWYQRLWSPIANAFDKGDWEFYLPSRTHHLRSYYTAEKIATYQETPYGFGLGTGLYNEHGNWEGVYAMAFQDSHFKPMYWPVTAGKPCGGRLRMFVWGWGIPRP